MDTKEITLKIKEILAKRNMSIRELGEKIGIDHGNLSRLLSGKRSWNLGHLQMMARGLKVDISDLLPNGRKAPILAEIGTDGEFAYDLSVTPLGHAPLPDIYRGKHLKDNFYCIRLREECEGFCPGTLLYAQREAADAIRDRDWVVCPRETGRANVARVSMKDDNTVILTQNGKHLVTLPKTHLKLCDRIVSVVMPL